LDDTKLATTTDFKLSSFFTREKLKVGQTLVLDIGGPLSPFSESEALVPFPDWTLPKYV